MDSWFSETLLPWYRLNKRDLPWRHTDDPYQIWLSEVILQQTQVAQGTSYFNRFIKQFPDITSLANATEDEVLKLWQGLGYYSRARNLHKAARQVVEKFNGVFPGSYEDIRSLTGVGDYTAAAIASFAFKKPYAVVDGNVYRVLSRIFGIETPIDSAAGKKEFQTLANEMLDRKKPDEYNQALMEFGATFCRPQSPDCGNCIFSSRCLAFSSGAVEKLPVKSKKTSVRARYFNYIVPIDAQRNITLNRREDKDIWQGLYQFHLLESAEPLPTESVLSSLRAIKTYGTDFELLHVSEEYHHLLTHQRLHSKFYVIKHRKRGKNSINVDVSELNGYAFPRLIEKFLQDCDLSEML